MSATIPRQRSARLSGHAPKRATPKQVEMKARRELIFDIVARDKPCGARHVYYEITKHGILPKDAAVNGRKTRATEKKIGEALGAMREASLAYDLPDLDDDVPVETMYEGYVRFLSHPDALAAHEELIREGRIDLDHHTIPEVVTAVYRRLCIMPFDWVTDDERVRYHVKQYDNRRQADEEQARLYRRNLWRTQKHHVEVWAESNATGSSIRGLVLDYGLDLLPAKGQSSKRFVWDSAQQFATVGKPVIVLYVGDFDPSGLDIGLSIEERMRRYLPRRCSVDIDFRRIAVTPEQVRDMGLQGHELNPNIPVSQRNRFFALCDEYGIAREPVEAEAMNANVLRQLVETEIEACIEDRRRWELELMVQAEERKTLFDRLRDLSGDGSAA